MLWRAARRGHSELARAHKGWGTALKPSWEPILVFRKPLEGTVTHTVLKHGTGGLNIDGCRVAADMSEFVSGTGKPRSGMGHAKGYGMGGSAQSSNKPYAPPTAQTIVTVPATTTQDPQENPTA